jgi:hypothetical protein
MSLYDNIIEMAKDAATDLSIELNDNPKLDRERAIELFIQTLKEELA